MIGKKLDMKSPTNQAYALGVLASMALVTAMEYEPGAWLTLATGIVDPVILHQFAVESELIPDAGYIVHGGLFGLYLHKHNLAGVEQVHSPDAPEGGQP